MWPPEYAFNLKKFIEGTIVEFLPCCVHKRQEIGAMGQDALPSGKTQIVPRRETQGADDSRNLVQNIRL